MGERNNNIELDHSDSYERDGSEQCLEICGTQHEQTLCGAEADCKWNGKGTLNFISSFSERAILFAILFQSV